MHAPHGLNPEPKAGNPIVARVVPVRGSRRSMTAGESDPFGCASTHTDPNPTPIARGSLSCWTWVILSGPGSARYSIADVKPLQHGDPRISCDAWRSAKNQSRPPSVDAPSILSIDHRLRRHDRDPS